MKKTYQCSKAILGLLLCCVGNLGAQTPNTFGTLSNFDVINDTGEECHGFEIELEDAQSADITYTFGAPYQRYGNPRIGETVDATGKKIVVVRYESSFDAAGGSFIERTKIAPSPINSPSGHACYRGGPIGNYDESGCEHFGLGLRRQPSKTNYYWILRRKDCVFRSLTNRTVLCLQADVRSCNHTPK